MLLFAGFEAFADFKDLDARADFAANRDSDFLEALLEAFPATADFNFLESFLFLESCFDLRDFFDTAPCVVNHAPVRRVA
jgi:hypothetical protein